MPYKYINVLLQSTEITVTRPLLLRENATKFSVHNTETLIPLFLLNWTCKKKCILNSIYMTISYELKSYSIVFLRGSCLFIIWYLTVNAQVLYVGR